MPKLGPLLMVHNAYAQEGGEDVCVRNEIAALREAGCDVTEFTIRNTDTLAAKANALLAPMSRGHEQELELILAQKRPAILHAHNLFPLLSPQIFSKARKIGVRTVLTLHNYRPLCLNGLFLTPKKEICERCAPGNYSPGVLRGCYREDRLSSALLAIHLTAARRRRWYEAVDLFIAPSPFLQKKYVQYGFPADKLQVQGHFLPDLATGEPVNPEPYVLYLGRLSEEKGVRWLLQQFRRPLLPVKLKVAGDGPLASDVQAACGEAIEQLGFLTGQEKITAIRNASAIIVPSECYESFSLVIAEANAYGVPALVSDLGALSHMVSPGENGDRYRPKDASAFWDALKNLLSQDTVAGRRQCQAYAQKQFSKSRFLEERLASYQSLLANL